MAQRNWEQLLDMACTHEEKLEKLYTVLAERFSDDSGFWQGLAQEERQHGAWLRQLKGPLSSGALRFDEASLRTRAIQSAIEYIEAMIGAVQRGRYPYVKVLGEIWDFQQNLLESGLFWAIQAPGEKDVPVIEQLAKATEQHRVMLEQKWQQEQHTANAL